MAEDFENLTDSETELRPNWLRVALRRHRDAAAWNVGRGESPTAAFVEKLHESAKLGLALSKLRRQREQTGFVPVPFEQYLQGLARMAAVALGPVLSWAGLAGADGLDQEAALPGVARLGRALEISFRQLHLHLRIGLAEKFEGAPVAVLLAGRSPANHGTALPDECDETLREVERTYGHTQLDRLQRLERGLQVAYEAAEATTA